MSTVEPHTPEPGWLRRWTVQSFQLLPRMGAGALLMAVAAWGIGGLALLAEEALTAWMGDTRLVQDVVRTAGAALGVPVLLAAIALFAQGDRGDAPDWAHLRAASLRGVRTVFLIGVALQAFVITLLGAWGAPGRPLLEVVGLLAGDVHPVLGAFSIGTDVLGSALLLLACFIGVVAAPLVVGMGAGWGEARLFDTRFRSKIPRVHRALWWIVVVGTVTSSLSGVLLGFAVLFFLTLWLFVAAREIVGGIRSNGKTPVHVPTSVAAQPSA